MMRNSVYKKIWVYLSTIAVRHPARGKRIRPRCLARTRIHYHRTLHARTRTRRVLNSRRPTPLRPTDAHAHFRAHTNGWFAVRLLLHDDLRRRPGLRRIMWAHSQRYHIVTLDSSGRAWAWQGFSCCIDLTKVIPIPLCNLEIYQQSNGLLVKSEYQAFWWIRLRVTARWSLLQYLTGVCELEPNKMDITRASVHVGFSN